jgi:hypothetical protein
VTNTDDEKVVGGVDKVKPVMAVDVTWYGGGPGIGGTDPGEDRIVDGSAEVELFQLYPRVIHHSPTFASDSCMWSQPGNCISLSGLQASSVAQKLFCRYIHPDSVP